MPPLLWPLLALSAFGLALALHLLLWGWVYRVRPDADALLTAECADGWRLAVAHYRPENPAPRPPVILCHGLAANRLNLCLPGANSLATFLRAKGFEVFVVDLRGCGDSARPPRGKGRNDWCFDDHLLQDAPAVLDLAHKVSGRPDALWVGHSMGGLIGLALAQREPGRALSGVAALGSPTRWEFHRALLGRLLTVGVRLAWSGRVHNKWGARLFAPILGRLPLPLSDLSVNPKNVEPATYRLVAYRVLADTSRKMLAQFASWFARNAWDLASPPADLRAGLAQVRCPVLLVAGAADLLAPPQSVQATLAELGSAEKELVVFGKARGDQVDYGHGDLIFGRHAPAEVFPELARWLLRAGAAR